MKKGMKAKTVKLKVTSNAINQISELDRYRVARGVIKEDYDEAIKEHGEQVKIGILADMMDNSYINAFPLKFRRYVKTEVSNFINENVFAILEDAVREAQEKSNISRRAILNRIINTGNFVNDIFPNVEIPEYFYKRLQREIDKFVERELPENEESEEENIVAEVSNQNDESLEEMKDEMVEKMTDKVDEKMNDKIPAHNDTEVQDENFYDKVAKYTHNFNFLASSLITRSAIMGNRDNEKSRAKFKKMDNAMKFIGIQTMIQKKMSDVKIPNSFFTKRDKMTVNEVLEMIAINEIIKGYNNGMYEIEGYRLDGDTIKVLNGRLDILKAIYIEDKQNWSKKMER